MCSVARVSCVASVASIASVFQFECEYSVWTIFTESVWADAVSKSRCPDIVCVFVRAIAKNPLIGGLETTRVSLILAYL